MGNISSLPEAHEILPLPVWLEHEPRLQSHDTSSSARTSISSSVGSASASTDNFSSTSSDRIPAISVSNFQPRLPKLDVSGSTDKASASVIEQSSPERFSNRRRMSMPDETSTAISKYLARVSSFKRSHTVHKRRSTRIYAAMDPPKTLRFQNDARYKKVKFLDFLTLKSAGQFPDYKAEGFRASGELHKRFTTVSADQIDFENAVTIFVSHCWIHGKNPKPDSAEHEKYALCIKAIEYVWEHWAPGMEKCYVWIDFSCINVERETQFKSVTIPNYEKEEFPLELIISCCDCMVTPLLDPTECWSPPKNPDMQNYMADLHATPWNVGPDAYLNRAWCRTEMLYCANIPLLEDLSPENSRRIRLQGRLTSFITRGQRPHVLYSDYQMRKNMPPFSFTPISNDEVLSKFHPCAGQLSDPSDRPIVSRLFHEVQKYMRLEKVGYDGEVNTEGDMHGQGTYRFANGDVFTGSWNNGLQHGPGVRKYSNGDKVVGEFNGGMEFGLCTYYYVSGDIYYGMLCNAQKIGRGILEYANGDVYEGFFRYDTLDGKGKMVYADGSIFDGEFKNGTRSGRGTLKSADGTIVQRGIWKSNVLQQRRSTM